MTWWQYLIIAMGVLVVSCIAGIYTGMAIDDNGADDRDDSKPADLWSGHERRKVRAGEAHDGS